MWSFRIHRHSYTMIEMIVVLVIIMLVVTLVAPRIGGGGRRMAAEQALSELREAYGETAMRARATGKPMALVLNTAQQSFSVSRLSQSLDKDWHPATQASQTGASEQGGILPGTNSYKVPDGIEWTELPEPTEGYNGIAYFFYPDGEAAGPQIAWTMHGRSYRLIIDSVLGKATILEEL